MVTLTIDNHQIEVPEGSTVLQAARKAGVEIPTLCDHPHLTPYGGCRLCMVEIDGFRTMQSACTIPAANNMVVRTDTEKIRAARKFVLTLIFSERNHFCMYCQVTGGDCELQNAAYGEGMTHWPLQPNWQPYPVDASHPYIILEHNRCILCRRCIRACSELAGANTLGVEERGARTFVIADLAVPLGESSCVSCGSCVQVCPTGALIDRRSAYRGKNEQADHTKSICVSCSLGCGIDLVTRDNQILRIDGDWDAEINGGVLCKAGRFLPLENNGQRLTTPMVRKDGALKPATWEEAYAAVKSAFAPLAGKSHDGVAALASTRLSTEVLNMFQQIFAEGYKSDMVTTTENGEATLVSSQVAAELGKAFEGRLSDLEHAGGILVAGTDLVKDHEVAGFFTHRVQPRGVRVVVVDTQDNEMENLSDTLFKVEPDMETAVFEGIAAALARLGLNKGTYAGDATEALNKAAEKIGVATDLFLKAAYDLAVEKAPAIVYGERTTKEALKALLKLAEVAEAKVVGIKGGANSLAAAQYGLDKAFKLNGQKAAFVALGDEAPADSLVRDLEKVPFLVVQASNASKLTAMAQVVLPVANWAEQEGHYLNLDGHIQTAAMAIKAPEGVYSNQEVLAELGKTLSVTIDQDWKARLLKRTAPVDIID